MMTALDDEDDADSRANEPRVDGSPDVVWLVYGDIEVDDTHRECCASGEVTWCEDSQFPSDVQYLRADSDELVALRKDAERYRWLSGNGWADPAFYAIGPREWGCNGIALLAGPQLDAALDGAMAESK